MGVARDNQGNLHYIVGSSEGSYLRAGVSLNPGEILAPGSGHAEENIIREAQQQGWQIITIGAGRDPCPYCADNLFNAGGTPATPITGPG